MALTRRAPQEAPEPIAQQAWHDARGPVSRLLRWAINSAKGLPGKHAAEHLVGGSDPFPSPGSPAQIQAGGVGSIGVGPGFLREDATFSVLTGVPTGGVGAIASEGSGGALMRASAVLRFLILTTKGDLLGFNGVDPVRVAVGPNGSILTANSAAATGWQWGPVVSSPAQLVANVNDYAPGAPGLWRLTSDASRDVTGILASTVAGQGLLVVNVGAFPVVLKHQNIGSALANRLICPGAADITLAADEIASGFYDLTTARWRFVKL